MSIQAVIFDMYETLVTQFCSPLYYGTQIAEDLGLRAEEFLPGRRAALRPDVPQLSDPMEVLNCLKGECLWPQLLSRLCGGPRTVPPPGNEPLACLLGAGGTGTAGLPKKPGMAEGA